MAKITTTARATEVTLAPAWKADLPLASYVQIYPRLDARAKEKRVSRDAGR